MKMYTKEEYHVKRFKELPTNMIGHNEVKYVKGYIVKLKKEKKELKKKIKDLQEKVILLKASKPMLEYAKYINEKGLYKERITKAIEYIENGDLLYLASKCSIIYKDNIEIVAICDRLENLLEILKGE